MIENKNDLYFSSADDTLGNFVIFEDGMPQMGDVEGLESTMRREALKYMGRGALRGLGHAGAAVGHAVLNGLDEMIKSID